MENSILYSSKNLVQPNFEIPGGPNLTNTKIYLSNFEYDLGYNHVEYFDKQMGTVQLMLGNKDVKFMKICTIK